MLDHGNHLRGRLPFRVTPALAYYRTTLPTPTRPRTPKGTTPRDRRLVLIRSAFTVRRRYGNIHPFIHSTTPVGLALGPDSPGDDERGPGTLGHPADGILTRLSLLMSAFSLPRVHGTVPRPLRPTRTLSHPTAAKACCRVFGGVLEPRYIVGAEPLDQ